MSKNLIKGKINAIRSGRVKTPMRSIDLYDPETDKKLGRIRFTKYGWGGSPVWAVDIEAEDLRIDVHLKKPASPELVSGSRFKGFWRFDPTVEIKERFKLLKETVIKLISQPVKVMQYYIEPENPHKWDIYEKDQLERGEDYF